MYVWSSHIAEYGYFLVKWKVLVFISSNGVIMFYDTLLVVESKAFLLSLLNTTYVYVLYILIFQSLLPVSEVCDHSSNPDAGVFSIYHLESEEALLVITEASPPIPTINLRPL